MYFTDILEMRLFIRKQIILLLVDIAIYYFCSVFFLFFFFCLFAHASIIRLASLKPFVSFIHLIPFSFEEHSSSLYRARVRRKLPLRKYRNIWCICHFPSLPLYFHRLFLFVTKNSRVREKNETNNKKRCVYYVSRWASTEMINIFR